MEGQVIRGGYRILERHHPLLIVELSRDLEIISGDTPEGVATMLRGLGYHILVVNRGRLVSADASLPDYENLIAVPEPLSEAF